jgi:hypothetical protein
MSDVTEGEGAEPATPSVDLEAGPPTQVAERPSPTVSAPSGPGVLSLGAEGGGPPSATGRLQLKAAEQFWYVLQCIAFGAGYFAKLPTKKALSEVGLTEMTGAEKLWYLLQCIAFGAGYFAKVPTKKALSDAGITRMTDAEQFWYVLQCIGFGAGYFAKIPHKKALSELAQLPTPAPSI